MQDTKIFVFLLILLLIVGCQTPKNNSSKYKNKSYEFKNYYIQKGDTYYGISKKFNTTIHEILMDNKLTTNKTLEIGQKLYIRSKYTKPKTSPKPTVPKQTYKPRLPKLNTKVNVKGNPPYLLIPRGTGYTKPVYGKITKKFSSFEGGRPLYGVNIRVSKSQSVKSIHNGVVVFTAETFANFGRCVMIAHSTKEKCFYFGLQKVNLKVGDVINKGYKIGQIDQYKTLGLKILRNDYFVNPQSVVPRL